MFSAKVFGQRLQRIRGSLTLEELSQLSGIPVHRMSRMEKGLTEKPPITDVVLIGKALGYSPNQMAALADLWVTEEIEHEVLSDSLKMLESLKQYLAELDPQDRERFRDLIQLSIVVHRRQRNVDDEVADVTGLLRPTQSQ